LDINDETKHIVQELGTAINTAVERSPEVANAIEKLREAGFELELTLKMEIGLRQLSSEDGVEETTELELTDEDMRTLRQMRIRIDDI
jgi:hypothetical protein